MNAPTPPPRPLISIPNVDRPSVQALVEEDVAYLTQARAAGMNVQQLGAERRDQIDKFLKNLPPLDAARFLNHYQEEITAIRKLNIAKQNALDLKVGLDIKARHVVVGMAILFAELSVIIYLSSQYFD